MDAPIVNRLQIGMINVFALVIIILITIVSRLQITITYTYGKSKDFGSSVMNGS